MKKQYTKDHIANSQIQSNKTSFTRVRNSLILDPNLHPYSKVIYITIAYHYPNAFPSTYLIANRTGLCRNTVDKYISELVEKGYLTRELIGRNYKYTLSNTWEFDAAISSSHEPLQNSMAHPMRANGSSGEPVMAHPMSSNHTKITILTNQDNSLQKESGTEIGFSSMPECVKEEFRKLGFLKKQKSGTGLTGDVLENKK